MTIHTFASLDLRAPGAKAAQINHFAVFDARELSDSRYQTSHDWLRLIPTTAETAAMPLTNDEEREAARQAMVSETTPPVKVGRIERGIGRLTVSYYGQSVGERFAPADPLRLAVSSYNYDDLTDAARGILNAAVLDFALARMDELPPPVHTDDEARAVILATARSAATRGVYEAVRRMRGDLGTETYRSNDRVSGLIADPDLRAAIIDEMSAAFIAELNTSTL